ncbi:C-type mannose receptor 2-like [Diadema antillarum]|uniref:C-type mannose receptor 2-like n=1 Tax=Diadema antillarum TaxID=105358 RepID=UPI003A85C4EB
MEIVKRKVALIVFAVVLCSDFFEYVGGKVVCPAGFSNVGSSCYALGPSKRRNDAQDLCQEMGANLVTVTSEDEQTHLMNFLSEAIPMESVWLGQKLRDALNYTWLNGAPLNFTDWSTDGNAHNQGSECVRLRKLNSWKWNDQTCVQLFPFICEIELGNGVGDCPQDFESRFHDSCYKVVSDTVSRPEAVETCMRNNGSHLVCLETVAERDHVVDLVEKSGMNDSWIGLTLPSKGKYRWISGENVGYTFYGNLDRGTDCLVFNHQDNYRWADRSCNIKFPFICETRGFPVERQRSTLFRMAFANSAPVAEHVQQRHLCDSLLCCAQFCFALHDCMAYAFEQSSGNCQISDVPAILTTQTRFNFYVRYDIPLIVFNTTT